MTPSDIPKFLAAVEQARESVRLGRVVPHDKVREWLKALAEGRDAPRPTAPLPEQI